MSSEYVTNLGDRQRLSNRLVLEFRFLPPGGRFLLLLSSRENEAIDEGNFLFN